jgi:thiamine-monophosphate kinase
VQEDPAPVATPSLAQLGEFGLIARLTAGNATRPDVLLAVGDDAALLDLDPHSAHVLVATCDALVEGRHFLRAGTTPEEIGHKALAVNLSDLAAMGAEPRWALVSLLLPPELEVALLDGVYAGMRHLARRFGVAIVGGNVSATPGPFTLDLTLLGRAERGRAFTRSGGKPGDALLVTGSLGAAAAGLMIARDPAGAASLPAETRERARLAYAAPEPRVGEGLALAATGLVTAMLDVSDGAAADLAHLCDASGVGVAVEATSLPISRETRAVCAAYNRDPAEFALTGGGDYELLFTVRPDGITAAQATVRAVGGEATVIGSLLDPASGRLLRLGDGAQRPLSRAGWDHLRAGVDS